MKRLILGIILGVPVLAFAWQPRCGFVVVSQSAKISSGSVGNLILLNCNSINPGLPNYDWLATQCLRYKAFGTTVLVEGDSSKTECA